MMVAMRWRLAAVFAALLLAPAAYAQTDYDTDDDGLIEIRTLAQLNAIRWDLDGNGTASSGNATNYQAAFPSAATGMGCPSSCTGYELNNDLDFDTNGNGFTHTSGTGDSGDAYYNGGAGWPRIGRDGSNRFNATFNGNGKVIANLFINTSSNDWGWGLFGGIGQSAVIVAVGLENAYVRVNGGNLVATLVGGNQGRVAACWASGAAHGFNYVGGLVAYNDNNVTPAGVVAASYSTASATATAGNGYVAGLVGSDFGATLTSYSTGRPTGLMASRVRGLVSFSGGGGRGVVASYWDTDFSGIGDDANADSPEGRTTAQLRAPTGYTGLYAAWDDQDVDGDGVAGEAVDDDAWDFGTPNQLPVLKFRGFDTARQFALQPPGPIVELSRSVLALTEGGSAAVGTWTVRLANLAPTGPVTVTVTSGDPALALTGAPVTLSFTTANWDTAQTVTARAVDDGNAAHEQVEVRHAASGANYGTGLVEAVLRVLVTDAEAPPSETILVPDAVLAAAVRAAVGKSAGQALTAWDLGTVRELDVSRSRPPTGAAVRDLSGAELMSSLRRLNLDNNEVADLLPLVDLPALEWLSARGNPLSSESVYVHAAALRARGVVVLLDPPALALLPDPGLRRAVEIALGKPPGSALTESDLLTLTSLNTAAGVRTLDGLEAASRLESLTLSGNAPAAGGAALDIQVLAGLRSLTHLDLSDNGLSDISALASLTGLRTLLLGGNAVEDLSPLAGLTGLEELTLSGNGLADVSALAGLSALQQLWLDGNALTDVGPLSGLGSLRYLHLGDNRIEELSPLSGLSELRRLWLPGNRVADVSALSGLRRLKRLDLSRNMVVNTAPLAGLPELSLLRLGWNRVADVSPLAGHAALTDGGVLGLRGNPLGADALERQVPALREAGAAVVAGWAVPLFPSASAPSGRGGFVRVLNRSETAGEVLVEAVDEAGRRFGPVRLALGPRQAAHFNSADLADGNAAKGLPEGVGPLAQGSWRLVVSSVLDIEVLSYLRGPGGFVTAAHGALPRDGERLSAFVFNPGGDRTQRSSLRVLNPGASVVNISAWGVDDAGRGRLATGFAAPAGGALAVTARELESSRRSGPGLGKGEGRWRLAVGAPWPVEALSLLESPGGHLSNLSSAPVQAGADEVLRLPLFPSASAGSGRQGFARVANLTAHDGWAEVSAVDDAGVRAGPARLRLPARATVHFDAADLEMGNVANGLSPGLGAPTRGSWRLELRSALDLRAGAYARHADGFLTSLHEAAPSAAGVARVAVFNPASNERQRSLLRLVNDGEEAARATITGRDDAGAEAGPVSVTVPAGEALTLTAVQLEEGGEGPGEREGPAPRMEMEGALGDGDGKWRLTVASNNPLVVMSLMESPPGHLTNLSATARP